MPNLGLGDRNGFHSEGDGSNRYPSYIQYHIDDSPLVGILCLRVTALYKGVRWVIWPLWVSFVILHGIRSSIALFGIISMASEWIYHQGSSRLIFSSAVSVEYSFIGEQCLPANQLKEGSLPTSYLAVLAPTLLDLILLVLTIVKAFKATAISGSYPSSPIVCVVFDFGLSLKPSLPHSRCARCCATSFCM